MKLSSPGRLRFVLLAAVPLLGGCWEHVAEPVEEEEFVVENPLASLVQGVAAARSPGSGALVAVAAHEGGDKLGLLGEASSEGVKLTGAIFASGESTMTVWLDPSSGLPDVASLDGTLLAMRDWSGTRVHVAELAGGAVRLERDLTSEWTPRGPAPTRTLLMSEAIAAAASAVGTVACLKGSGVRAQPSSLCNTRGLTAFASLGPTHESALAASAVAFKPLGAGWGCSDAASCGQRLVTTLYFVGEGARATKESLAATVDLATTRLRLSGTWRLTHIGGTAWQADAIVDQVLFAFSADPVRDRVQTLSRDVLGCFWTEQVELDDLTPTTLSVLERGVRTPLALDFTGGRLQTTYPNGTARGYERVSSSVASFVPACLSHPTTLSIQSGDAQVGERGRTLAQPLVARVLDRRGAPVAGVPVAFQARPFYGADDDGRFSATGVSNALGVATGSWQLSTRGEHNHAVVAVAADPSVQAEATACASFQPAPLALLLNRVDRRSGLAEVGGTDTRRPKNGARFDWGDGQQTTGSFPQTHVYANAGVDYKVTVTGEYCDGSRQVETITVNARVDDFETLDGTRWQASQHQLGRGWVRPANVSQASSRAQLALSSNAYDGSEIRSTSKYQYGSYEARMKTPRAPGSLSAFFLYESNLGLDNDEIDIEIFNDDSRRIHFTTWIGGVLTNTVEVILPFDPSAAFHDYRIEWAAGNVRFLVDGITRATFTSRVPQKPMHVFSNAWWPTWMSGPFPAQPALLLVDRILY